MSAYGGIPPREDFVPCREVERAVAADVRALRVAGSDLQSRCIALGNLAISLYSRHRCQGGQPDLDAAIGHMRSVLRLLPAGHPERNTAQGNLAMMLAARHTPEDLDDAIALWRAGLAPKRHGSPDWATSAGQLAQGLFELFTLNAEANLLEEALALMGSAVRVLPVGGVGDHLRANRAVMLLTRHQVIAPDPDGLDEAITALEEFLGRQRSTGGTDAERQEWAATHLAQALMLRYTDRGDPEDITRASSLRKTADTFTGDFVAPGSRMGAGQAIGSDIQATVALFEYMTDARQADLDQAILDQQKALDRCGEDVVRRSPLVVNLAVSLAVRHHARRGLHRTDGGAPPVEALADLTRAVELLQGNLAEDVPVQHRAGATALSGMLLLDRHMTDPVRHAADLAAAGEYLSRALEMPGLDHRSRIGVMSRLAYCRLAVARTTGDAESLESAVGLARRAAEGIAEGSPLRAGALGCLADMLLARAETTRLPTHQQEAGELLRSLCHDYADSDRAAVYLAARGWSESAWRRGAMAEVAEAGQVAVPLLHDIASLQLGREGKAVALRQADGLAARTAFALASAGRAGEAAVVLEAGRAVMLAETMQREHPDLLRLLSGEYRNLSSRFRRAAEQLSAQERLLLTDAQNLPVVDGTREAYRARLRELRDVVHDIRALPGFGTFLNPPAAADVVRTADACRSALVYLAATDKGGVALLVPPGPSGAASGDGRVRIVPLPRLTVKFERRALAILGDAVVGSGSDDPADLDEAELAVDELSGLLWEAVMAPVVAELGTGTPAVLVPDGPLGALPLHAASRPDPHAPTGRRFAVDDLPITTAPSARTLDVAVGRTSAASVRRVLAVRDPAPSTEPPLPGAAVEIERIRLALPPHVRVEELHGRRANRREVQQALAEADICHFACHAHFSVQSPLDGGLGLAHGERLSVRDMFAMPAITARLAVLSACDSARSDEGLPEEAVGLATGFFQAGFGAVIASLWPVEDAPAAAQMALTYRYWLGEGKPLPEAVADAMKWLRDSTNEQKLAAFPELDLFAAEDLAAVDDPRWRGGRDHSSPLVWAAFSCMGI
ncbi:CHAT domain-containing protein [Streptomyces sp. NPDC008150]|uniref:CHAT domain-containing protein n=1 Tax=Streptomyces sp. NPDC008150 TaxID=3364816 RepID=UPI0036E776D3